MFSFNAHLCPVRPEKGWRVHAVGNGTPDEREPVEHHRRLIGVLEEDLLEDVDEDRDGDEANHCDTNLRRGSELEELLGQRPQELLSDTHS